jgi:hypothetical protein
MVFVFPIGSINRKVAQVYTVLCAISTYLQILTVLETVYATAFSQQNTVFAK